MMLTKNFSLSEFYCHDESNTPVPGIFMMNVQKLAVNLQVLRDEIGEPVHVNSGFRTPAYNKSVGGKSKSQHLLAAAADIVTKSYTPKKLAAIIERLIKAGRMKEGGIGIYPSWVHYDIRKTRARW